MREIKPEIEAVKHFLAKNAVLCVAAVAAIVTMFFVPPDEKYAEYFDLKTLACLFSVLAVVCALKNIKFFTIIARKIVKCFRDIRLAIIALVFITFFGSMLIANDMALLTFLPLGYFVLLAVGKQKLMAFTFTMQNIAANLGGMLTPFGNPQNLYIYSKFNIPTGEFMGIMLPPFIAAIIMIIICCLFVKPEKLPALDECEFKLNAPRTAAYLVLFAIAIIIVFRVIPYYIGLAVIIAALLFLDRKALLMVDYGLLLTFVAFFIFSGNMGRIPEVREFFSFLLEKDTLLVSVLSCQAISNVPTAVLLSQFTANYRPLLIGVNIGGAGTIIASLASLITLREYQKCTVHDGKHYLILFSALNFGFLIILTVLSELFFV